MKLSDNEIRDITKLLEEGKTLPDKYRFMLFGDEREIELVWNVFFTATKYGRYQSSCHKTVRKRKRREK